MLLFQFDGPLFALKAKTPALAPLSQLPPRINAFFRAYPLDGAAITAPPILV